MHYIPMNKHDKKPITTISGKPTPCILQLYGKFFFGKTRANAKSKRTIRHSLFQALEEKLYQKFQEMRSKDRKVSSTWITVSTKKIFVELQEKEPDEW